MFKFISIEFPDAKVSPKTIYRATITQKRYHHETAVIEFKDWGAEYDSISPGSPVRMVISSTGVGKRNFYGYVHHLSVDRTPGKNFTEVTIVGGSFPMKQRRQRVYKETTADQIIKEIAASYNMACYAVAYPRVFPQVSQAGLSDWEFMVNLAKQCGYSLRTENTELYFQPILEDYTKYRTEAPKFVLRSASHPDGSSLYSFTPTISESMPYAEGTKAAIAVSGVDVLGQVPMSVAQQVRNKTTRTKKQIEFFDLFATDIVAQTPEVAKYEAEAAENRAHFPYRATAEVIGSPELRPDMPIYVEGVGAPYSGYWIVLETEHKIIEKNRNVFQYTTVLHLGADSLGSSDVWTDSKTVISPSKYPKRTVIPNVKQTKVKPVTALNTKIKVGAATNKGSFGTIENRANVNNNARAGAPSTWATLTKSLDILIPVVKKPVVIVNRLAIKRMEG